MIIGYARTSTLEQEAGFEAQIKALTEAGAEKIFQEQVSSVQQRAELMRALEFAREGDVFLVTKLDRLARSVEHLIQITDTLERKKVTLRIQNLNLDTSTPTGKLMLNVMGSIAQFEREIMLERQREGIAKAKADGKYKGRVPTARVKADRIRELKAAGLSAPAIAKELNVSERSVWRMLA